MNRDDILDYGNYDSERLRTSAQTQIRRVSISTSAELLRIERGALETYARNLQRTFSGAASIRIRYEGLLTASAGGFDNDYDGAGGRGRDRTLFWSVAGQTALGAAGVQASGAELRDGVPARAEPPAVYRHGKT